MNTKIETTKPPSLPFRLLQAHAQCLLQGTFTIEEVTPKKGGDLHIDVSGSCAKQAVSSATYFKT